ncbi:MAG: hypothetical protein VB120_07580 [Lachnospiraceae bacterium]|nr:hypothetical protein [Lachnospiraceae bacterium]
MDQFYKNLANLLKVKTLVTIAVLFVFAILAIKGTINPESVMNIVMMVISFYFGTQIEKSQ